MKIKSYKKMDSNCYKILFTNSTDVLLYDEVILKHNLLLKKEISLKELEEIKKENTFFSCYYKALTYLAYKNRSKKEIKEYLKKQHYTSSVIDKTILLLEEKKIIDDKKYLEMYIHDQIHLTHHGPKKIKEKVMDLGFHEEEIEEKLAHVERKIWQEKLEKIVLKKVKANHKDGSNRVKDKIMLYCLQEGFLKEDILSVLDSLQIPENHSALEKEVVKLYNKLSLKYQGEELEFQIKGRLLRKGFSYEEVVDVLEGIKKSSSF